MSTAVWLIIYALLIGYGVGVRTALHYQRKEAKQAAAKIREITERTDTLKP